MKNRAVIRCDRRSPYRVENLHFFRDSEGNQLALSSQMYLCRCGATATAPFCDGSHRDIGFRAEKKPHRIKDKFISYRGEKITIHDNRGICSHNMACIDELPRVFNMARWRWIDPDAASPEAIIRVIEMCPSGSLSYTYRGSTYRGLNRPPGIIMDTFGPYEVVGCVAFRDDMGSIPGAPEHYTICRCGRTRNAPFCDGTHFRN